MELNTPNKNQITSTNILSQFEDSPVFNYINNLSPIELVKSIHTGQTFNLPSFTSPISVFASPQLSSRCETRSVVMRGQVSEPSKPELIQSKDENRAGERVLETANLAGTSAEQSECFTPGSSVKEVTNKLSEEQLELEPQEPKALKHGCASPDDNIVMVPLSAITEPQMAGNASERHSSYENEKDLQRIGRNEQNEDEAGCDWVALVSDVADILTFETSIDKESAEEQQMVDSGTISFISNALQIPQDNSNDSETSNCTGSSQQREMGEPGLEPKEFGEQKEKDQTQSVFPRTISVKPIVNDTAANVDTKEKNCQSSIKQHKLRRRCLLFDMGAFKKKLAFESHCSSSSSQSDGNGACIEKHANPSKSDKGKTLSSLSGRGMGLHLNALTATGNGKAIKIETQASGKQEISQPPSPSIHLTPGQDPAIKSLALTTAETDIVPFDDKNKVMENTLQTSMAVSQDVRISSPKMKRQKLEYVGLSCKRCNCKRSKCLKLYCECFAAGLYCIEPCSCQDCFNNPAHEDTVLETRRQIETRNPLAFAPKVIRTSDSVSELGDDTNKTPASARHKRGCNCKKSGCLKKYCECFQGGVGCSSYCRCEGCKNTFGCVTGFEENDRRIEESKAHERDASDLDLLDIDENGEVHPDHTVPMKTPSGQLPGSSLCAAGSSIQMRTIQKFRTNFFCQQPKYEKHLQAIPEDETPDILQNNCSSTSGVKSASPNCKRVSPPPHHGFGSSASWRRGRKLILRSVPASQTLDSPCEK